VSVPVDWAELDDPDLRPDGFPLREVTRRLQERGDLFAPVLQQDQALPELTGT
jgi:bifunctional non-homologous end joining protein LigD